MGVSFNNDLVRWRPANARKAAKVSIFESSAGGTWCRRA